MSLCFCKSSLECRIKKYHAPTVTALALQAYKYFYLGFHSQQVTAHIPTRTTNFIFKFF